MLVRSAGPGPREPWLMDSMSKCEPEGLVAMTAMAIDALDPNCGLRRRERAPLPYVLLCS